MYLSKLEIVGFKSFAQKVNLAFDAGISAIVGPNGCGKTNIVDAIRWVLGEQRYSALRSDKMEDVIFNGTKSRKALGMAEASLVIENTKGILPSEYSQVTIGRRVYRSGESEYLLNKVPCRLKDILDLFMDTGMGSDAYSVIELKMIETILSDKTDERRRLFEEAAGVTKYKHRRKAAYRKLESVQADLLRVNDIVAEVQKAVNSLERQARKAEQFNDVKTRLRTLEIDVMEREYAQMHLRMVPLKEKLQGLTVEKSQIDENLGEEESRLEGLRTGLLDVEKRLAEAQRDVSEHLGRMHRIEEKNLVAAERTKSLQSNIERLQTEEEDLRVEQHRLRDTIATRDQLLVDLAAKETAVTADLALKREELADCESRLESKKAELQQQNEKTISLVHEIAERQTALEKKRGRIENLGGRVDHALAENDAYQEELVRLDGEVEALTAQDKVLRRSFTEAEMAYYDAEKRKSGLQASLESLQAAILDIRGEIDRDRGRIDFLKGLIESGEGMSEGVRYLSSSQSWKPSRAANVADAVHAEDRFRAAIEAALGEHASLMIVNSASEAESGIGLLKKEDKGKATFVALDRLPKFVSRIAVPALPGVYGWAAEIAQYDAEYAPLFRYLLDRVLVVDNRKTAADVSARVAGVRCVTLDGEIASGSGVTRGGSRRMDEGGLIGKRRQIQDLESSVRASQDRLDTTTRQREAVLAEHDAMDLKPRLDGVKGIEKEMNGVEMKIAQLVFEKKRAADTIARNLDEIEKLRVESRELQTEIDADTPGLEALRTEKSDVERKVGAVTSEQQALEEDWNQRSSAANGLAVALATARGELQTAQNEHRIAGERLGEVVSSLERHAGDIARNRDDVSTTDAGIQENATALSAMQEELSRLKTARADIEVESRQVRNDIHAIELSIRDRRRTHDESLRILHETELKVADLQAKSDHIVARAKEEFELEISLKTYPDDEFVDFAALRDEIQTLRDKIKSLGNINFAAFEEYQTEKQRSEFMSTQRNDLIEAEKTLLATIEEINATAQKQFLDTFALIRTNFIETFKSLFDPGDECDLKLEEEVDPLEARIEIVAKPRGKRPTSIDLLSGGEKTLTATALLFAIYLVKPSPFCILDEVDAPLDDANVDRFTRILRKFSVNTQFIVVTHNKRTMEAANALYGVTMEEEGVSKLVTVRFNQGSQVASAAVASA